MAVDAVVGEDCKAYYNTGTYATPTWVEIDQASDVSVTYSKNTAQASIRAQGFVFYGNSMKDISVSLTYVRELRGANDTVFDALEGMYWDDDVNEMAFVDGAIATSATRGVRAHFLCDDMSEDQSVGEFLSNEFQFRPVLFDDSGTKRVPQHWEAA